MTMSIQCGRNALIMNKEKAIYIVGSVSLPRVDAGASRILELSKGFKAYFNKIIIAGKYDKDPHNYYEYDDKTLFLPYHTIANKNVFDKIHTAFFPKKSIINDLKGCLGKYNVTHIVIYSALEIKTVKAINKLAKQHNIRVIYDVVEFQTANAQSLMSYFSFYLPNMRINKRIIKKGDSVISISSYLNDYFLNKGCNSVQIPFVYQTKDIDTSGNNLEHDCINLMYAGSPKKNKDLLANSIKGMALLPEKTISKVHYYIAGMTKNEFLKKNKGLKKYLSKTKDNITFLGKVSNEEVKELYKKCDFSILIRDENSRLSKAGFPTKVSESLVHGVPVICNVFSDLGNYLIDNQNSIIMKNSTPEEFARCVTVVADKSKEELLEMRKNARATSEKKLDISLFDNQIKKVLGI